MVWFYYFRLHFGLWFLLHNSSPGYSWFLVSYIKNVSVKAEHKQSSCKLLPLSTMVYQCTWMGAGGSWSGKSKTRSSVRASMVNPGTFGETGIAEDGQNLTSSRWSLHWPTNPVWWRLMHTILSYRGNRRTCACTHPQTDRTDYNTLRCS